MSDTNDDVSFVEEEQSLVGTGLERAKKYPMMVNWIIKAKIAKTEFQANLVILAVAVIAFAMSFYLFSLGSKYSSSVPSVTISAPEKTENF